MTIYLPKQIVPLLPTTETPLFFLAGPVRGGGDWQADMAESIMRKKSGSLIACPSRWGNDHRLAPHFNKPFSKAPNRQLVWEHHYLKQAGLESDINGCVIFWLGLENVQNPHPGPEPYAMDTRREIGKFAAYAEMTNVRLVIGGDPHFHGLDVILFELKEAIGRDFRFHETMLGVVCEALSIAKAE